MQYARLQLYYIYNEAKKKNKNIIVKKVYTDSITFNEQIITKKNIDVFTKNLQKKYDFGVKIEKSSYMWNHVSTIIKEPKIIECSEMTKYSHIDKILDLNKSFLLSGRAGYGKTYTINNELIPYFKKNNKKYILSSTTLESSKLLDCKCIHSLLLSDDSSLSNINKMFKNIDYLIIDECSRLNINLLNIIQHVKMVKKKLKVIMVGDINQCSYDNIDIFETEIFKNLIDHNIFQIIWHNKSRYSFEYDKFLDELLNFDNGGKDKKCIEHIKAFFGENVKTNIKCDKNKIKLTWTHNKGKKLNYSYSTVHKSQGKTIDEEYSIYEINKMPLKVLYTALSRCTNYKLITLYLK